jgi:uncharacterized protein YijF (DUF1287 family)
MLRRTFLSGSVAVWLTSELRAEASGARFAEAAQAQIGVTTGYDPSYTRIAYPGGDVPRTTGVCADVIVRAARDGLSLDLQKLVHEDMLHAFNEYPHIWRAQHPDPNIDHRRVPNLETYWRRAGARLWGASAQVAGDAFPLPLRTGDLVTWMLNGALPHVAIVTASSRGQTQLVHNIGDGARAVELSAFRPHLAKGHYRWP